MRASAAGGCGQRRGRTGQRRLRRARHNAGELPNYGDTGGGDGHEALPEHARRANGAERRGDARREGGSALNERGSKGGAAMKCGYM